MKLEQIANNVQKRVNAEFGINLKLDVDYTDLKNGVVYLATKLYKDKREEEFVIEIGKSSRYDNDNDTSYTYFVDIRAEFNVELDCVFEVTEHFIDNPNNVEKITIKLIKQVMKRYNNWIEDIMKMHKHVNKLFNK